MADPQAVVRRAVLALAAGLFLTLALHTAWHVETIWAWAPLPRYTKLAASTISLLSGLLTAGLLLRDLWGRTAPIRHALQPAWLVVGTDLLFSYVQHGRAWLLLPAGLALVMGLAGTLALFRGLRKPYLSDLS